MVHPGRCRISVVLAMVLAVGPAAVARGGSARAAAPPGLPHAPRSSAVLVPVLSTGRVGPDVVGGRAAQPGRFPWMVRLSTGCDGSVLSRWVVLTAAHCVDGTGPDTRIVAIVGRTRLSAPGGWTVRSRYVMRSPRYASSGTVDWALVELAQPVPASPLPLAGQGDLAAERGWLTVVGWGATAEGGGQSDVLQYATVPYVDDAACSRSYPHRFRPATEMCAGYPQGGVDTCQGDSGGPMVATVRGRAVQVGITSYGRGCGRSGYPGVYAEVPAFSAEITAHLGRQGELVA